MTTKRSLESHQDTPTWTKWGFVLLSLFGCSAENEAATTSFLVTIENASSSFDYPASGVFPDTGGDYATAPVPPGESYEFSFPASPGMRLSLASMFVQSNDWFVGTDDEGIALFDEDDEPTVGEVTDAMHIIDAGTEESEPPGEGEHQAPRQSEHDSGPRDPNDEVRVVEDYEVADFVRVSLSFDTDQSTFTVLFENVSKDAPVRTPFAPGAFVVHDSGSPLYSFGQTSDTIGLEALAEDGDPSTLVEALMERTGVPSDLSPGIWVLHQDDAPLFSARQEDFGDGMKDLAEEGDPSVLESATRLPHGVFDTPVGGDEEGPATPGQKYEFSFQAAAGDRLSFATMLVESNDLFAAPNEDGIELFENGLPISRTIDVAVWDLGTEQNQPLGFGSNQAPRQSEKGQGKSEDAKVREAGIDAERFVVVSITSK